jgi:hypothetical protein
MANFDHDGEAWSVLKLKGYTEHNGMIFPPALDHKELPDETEAINYLCSEWDYGFMEDKSKYEEELNRRDGA